MPFLSQSVHRFIALSLAFCLLGEVGVSALGSTSHLSRFAHQAPPIFIQQALTSELVAGFAQPGRATPAGPLRRLASTLREQRGEAKYRQIRGAHFSGAQWWRRVPALNVVTRTVWALFGVTWLHEEAHSAVARGAGQIPSARFWDRFFRGETDGIEGKSLLAGTAANAALGVLVALGLSVTGQWDFAFGHLLSSPWVYLSYLALAHGMAAVVELADPQGDVRRYLNRRPSDKSAPVPEETPPNSLAFFSLPRQPAEALRRELIDTLTSFETSLRFSDPDEVRGVRITREHLKALSPSQWEAMSLSPRVQFYGPYLVRHVAKGDAFIGIKAYYRHFKLALDRARILLELLEGVSDQDRHWMASELPHKDPMEQSIYHGLQKLLEDAMDPDLTQDARARHERELGIFVNEIVPRRQSAPALAGFLADYKPLNRHTLMKQEPFTSLLTRWLEAAKLTDRDIILVRPGDPLPWLAIGETREIPPSSRVVFLRDGQGSTRRLVVVTADPRRRLDLFVSLVGALSVAEQAEWIEKAYQTAFGRLLVEGTQPRLELALLTELLGSPDGEKIAELARAQVEIANPDFLIRGVSASLVLNSLSALQGLYKQSDALVGRLLASSDGTQQERDSISFLKPLASGHFEKLSETLGVTAYNLLRDSVNEIGAFPTDLLERDILFDSLVPMILSWTEITNDQRFLDRFADFREFALKAVVNLVTLPGDDLQDPVKRKAIYRKGVDAVSTVGDRYLSGVIERGEMIAMLDDWVNGEEGRFESASVHRLPRALKWLGIPSLVWLEESVHLLSDFGWRAGLRQIWVQRLGLYQGEVRGRRGSPRPMLSAFAGPLVSSTVGLTLLPVGGVWTLVGSLTLFRTAVDIFLAFTQKHHELHPAFRLLRSAA